MFEYMIKVNVRTMRKCEIEVANIPPIILNKIYEFYSNHKDYIILYK